MYVYVYLCVCLYVCICVYVCTCACIYVCMYVCIYVYMCACMYICVYVFVYVYVYMCVFIYVFICGIVSFYGHKKCVLNILSKNNNTYISYILTITIIRVKVVRREIWRMLSYDFIPYYISKYSHPSIY